MLRLSIPRYCQYGLPFLSFLLAPYAVGAQSNFSFTKLPTSSTLISSTGRSFSFTYLGPFNTAAYPGESGVNPQPAVCSLSDASGTTLIDYTASKWSASNWWGTIGPAPLTNILYAYMGEAAQPNSTNSFSASGAGFFVYQVNGPATINGSSNYTITVTVAYGAAYFAPMYEMVASVSGPNPGYGTVTGTDGGLPASLTVTQAAHQKPQSASLSPSTGGAVYLQVPMINGVGHLYIGADVSITGSITQGQVEDLDQAIGESDYETVMEAVASP
jgi:hypothetical protein